MITFDIEVEAPEWDRFDVETLVVRCGDALTALAPEGYRPGEVTILFTRDDEVHVLNRDWRGKDKPTNVLSFPADEDMPLPEGVPAPLGDLALGYETCQRESEEKGIPLTDHSCHLIVHGILHLFGYDHLTDEEAEEMESLEIRLLASLGIADPYGPAANGDSDA